MRAIGGVSITVLLLVLVAALLPSGYSKPRGKCINARQCGAAFGKRGDMQFPTFDDTQLELQSNRRAGMYPLESEADNIALLQSLLKLIPQERQHRFQQDYRMADDLFSSRQR